MAEKFKVLIFDEELHTLRSEKYVGIDSKDIETKEGMYPLKDALKVYNESDGLLYYIFNLDLPAKVEAENLKLMRRSSAIANLFKYDTKKPFDLIGFMPWVVIIIMAIFM